MYFQKMFFLKKNTANPISVRLKEWFDKYRLSNDMWLSVQCGHWAARRNSTADRRQLYTLMALEGVASWLALLQATNDTDTDRRLDRMGLLAVEAMQSASVAFAKRWQRVTKTYELLSDSQSSLSDEEVFDRPSKRNRSAADIDNTIADTVPGLDDLWTFKQTLRTSTSNSSSKKRVRDDDTTQTFEYSLREMPQQIIHCVQFLMLPTKHQK